MAVKVKLDPVAVREVPLRLVRPLVDKAASSVERRSRTQVRVLSGAVRASIRSDRKLGRTKYTVTIGSHHRRAMLEHQGAKRHTISQRPGGPLLHFYWSKVGHFVTFRSVNHPGTKGSKFLTSPLLLYGLRNGFKVTISLGGISGTITP